MKEDFYFENWPRSIAYDLKQNSLFNAKLFLDARPHKLVVARGGIYSLNNGIWRIVEEDSFAAEVQATNEPTLLYDVGDILALIRAVKVLRHTDAQPFEWIKKPVNAPDAIDMIPFKNGLLDFKTKKLWPYDGSYFATGRPDFKYDPKAKCPRWRQALEEWFEQSSDSRVTMVETLQEFFGYALTPDIRYHAILSLLGAPRGGKSTIVHILEGLCGALHFKSRGLGDLGGPHGLQDLENARVLLIPDATDSNLAGRSTALGRIKAISGGDMIGINPKNMKPFETRIPARIVLVANRHPKFLDESGAMAMRELPIMFTRSFQDDKKKDPELVSKLIKELPGIANWALEGLARLRDSGRFSEGEALREARDEIEGQQSHMASFARECLQFKAGAWTSRAAMFEAYERWHLYARIAPREVRNREEFKTDLLAACSHHGVQLKQHWIDGHNKGRMWRGVELNKARLKKIAGETEPAWTKDNWLA
jgi:P4 family phage/plasmid primase-like protien